MSLQPSSPLVAAGWPPGASPVSAVPVKPRRPVTSGRGGGWLRTEVQQGPSSGSPDREDLPSGLGPAFDRTLGVTKLAAWLVAAVVFLSISRFHQHFGGILAKLQVPLLLSIAGLIALANCTSAWKPADLRRHWIPVSVFLLLIIAIIGVPLGIYPGRSFFFITDTFSRTVMLALMVWACARTPAGMRFMTYAFTVSCIAANVLALMVGRTDRDGRLSGGYTCGANDLALIAVVAVPLCVWWMIDRTAKHKWVPWVSMPLLVKVIVESDSRGGFLGILAVVAGFLVLTALAGGGRLRKVSIALVFISLAGFPLLPSEYRARVASILDTENDYNMTSESGRWQVWGRGLGYMWDHPATGVGIANFRTAEGKISELARERPEGKGLKWSAAHNSYVQIGAEMGIAAGLLFVMLTLRTPGALIGMYRRHLKRWGKTRVDLLPPLLALAMIGFVVAGFFLSFAYGDVPYILMALSGAMLLMDRDWTSAMKRGVSPAAVGRVAAPGTRRNIRRSG